MTANNKLKFAPVLFHVLVWSVLLALPHYFIPAEKANLRSVFFPGSFFFFTNFFHIILFYLNAFVLYPLFFNKKRWLIYGLLIAALFAVSFYLKLIMVRHWYTQLTPDGTTYLMLFFPTVLFILISLVYRMVIDKIAFDKKQKDILAERLAIELKFLRSQISPHFIFNVLANLVSLARKKSNQMEPALMMLSDLMRYMLYEFDQNKVLLSTEISYLKSYIALQHLRFGDEVSVIENTDIPDHLLNHYSIQPMLLIPFIENAFKHGVDVDDAFIEINIKIDNDRFQFTVRNKFNYPVKGTKDESGGIGLDNVRSRLALLYPQNHTLVITDDHFLFEVQLTLLIQ
jgi:two-component system LytT family sensor kinase